MSVQDLSPHHKENIFGCTKKTDYLTLFREIIGRGLSLHTDLHVELKLRISAARSMLSRCALVARTRGPTFTFAVFTGSHEIVTLPGRFCVMFAT